MKSITQDLKFKQAVIDYSFNHGVTNASIRYKKTLKLFQKNNKIFRQNYSKKLHFVHAGDIITPDYKIM